MSGVNKVILVGRLGKDPEARSTKDGKAISSFSMATSKNWTDKQTGEKKEKTEWHNIVAFGKTAEICNQYLKKGNPVYIEGELTTEKYQAKDGTDRYTTKIMVDNVQLLGSKGDNANAGAQPQGNNNYQAAPPQGQLDADGF